MPTSDASIETVEGHIERITYRSADSGFLIAKLRTRQAQKLVTVLGHIPEPRAGETLRLKGRWTRHPRYGHQFKVSGFEVVLPSDVEQIRRYLGSGLIKGIGLKTAEQLIAHFKDSVLRVIEQEPDRLCEVRGIGPQKAGLIHRAWQEHHAVRALMQFLQDHDIDPANAARVYKRYGTGALEVLRSDPYRVAADIPRIGFHIADAVVRRSDRPVDEGQRAEACVRHLLDQAYDRGHIFIPRDELEQRCGDMFQLDYHALQEAMEHLTEQGVITVDLQAPGIPIYLKPFYLAETEIALRLRAMASMPAGLPRVDPRQIMETAFQRLAIQLSDAQMAVLQSVFHQRVVVITGGPGTGKTTLIRSIAAVYDAVGCKYLLAAPTGRAARRVAELTGRSAATLHRLLRFNLADGTFDHDQDHPLETDALIVDEASMVDLMLMGHVIEALPHNAALILVGDVAQLPSVGPGTVLADLIGAKLFKIHALDQVYRQAAESPITANAHRVRTGRLPELTPRLPDESLTDFSFIEAGDPEQITRHILALCTHEIPDQLELDGVRDVQVLTPMHKGPLGTLQLNRRLQAALNPGADKSEAYRAGDKVMHLRNNYQKEVFNGEIGMVCDADSRQGRWVVDYDDRQVTYDEADLDELSLAYAISVHKSQGSEYPVIILPLVTQHYIMLQRNLLYTALTRARQMVVLIGSAKAVRVAVQTDMPRGRLCSSLLSWRLNPSVLQEPGWGGVIGGSQ
jgi:exodeoxyribonuclease V alpha subunit